MNNETENMVTIPLDLFIELLEYKNEYNNIYDEFNFIIDKAELNYSKDDLRFEDSTMKKFLKRYNKISYEKKYKKLIKENEENE